MSHSRRCSLISILVLSSIVPWQTVIAADLTAPVVLDSIERGRRYLITRQERNGSWAMENLNSRDHADGIAALAVLALITSGMTASDPPVKRGLDYLRKMDANRPEMTYDISLTIMALVAAKDPNRSDLTQITLLADRLARGQNTEGNVGAWSYHPSPSGGGGDPSNTQFAVLGLREAVEAGVVVPRAVWERTKTYWENLQNADGGWAYSQGGTSTGSMTVAGIASLSIAQQMLRTDEGVAPDGTPPCCRPEDPYPSLERGLRWLANSFAVGHNPGTSAWLLYYLYGIERAGRLSGKRFFGEHDWYREGAAFLLAMQMVPEGTWRGAGIYEDQPLVGTCLSLLFLSKGLAPVLMSKLQHGPRDPTRPAEIVSQDWNHHPRDVRNLMEHVSGLPRWPKLLTSQEVDLLKATKTGGVDVLLQAPMLFLTGEKRLQFSAPERELIKEYLYQGGFLLAAPSCQGGEFEASLRELLAAILPPGEGELKPLPADHPVYRSEYLLSPEGVPIHGVDLGCRTAVMFVPEDLGCLWSYWQRHDPPKRNPQFKARIVRSVQIGVNIAAYATGREPPQSLDAPRKAPGEGQLDEIERGLLQVAQLRHSGNWNAAPRALRNLLLALNETVGLAATTKPKDLPPSDPSLFQYPLLYMHGRTRFSLSGEDREAIKLHLTRGGVLFADACCGAQPFDKSFREMVSQLYPDEKFLPIPIGHEIFSEKIGRDVRRVRRRTTEGANPNAPLTATVREVEPYLEGIEIDGRYVIVYSKYDISCALEKQSTLSCEGYLPEDAVKLATNIVLYALLQDVSLAPAEK
jgi:hypothetical protein